MKMNTVTMIGNLTADATVCTGEKNNLVIFNVAVNLPSKGEDKTQGHFFRVESWVGKDSKLPETLKKGTEVVIDNGKLLERTTTRQDGTTSREAYISVMSSNISVVKDGWVKNNSTISANATIAKAPEEHGKVTIARVCIDGLYNKEKKANDVMFLDVVFFGDVATWALANRHKGDGMNITGRLVTNKRQSKDGKTWTVPQILMFDYPDVFRYAKNTEGENEAVAASPIIDDDDEAIPF